MSCCGKSPKAVPAEADQPESLGGGYLAAGNSLRAGLDMLCQCVQVHEKSILLALLPVTLLALHEPAVAAWLPVWSTLSLYPLLKKDGLSIAYLACLLLWLAVAPPPSILKGDMSSTQQLSQAARQVKGTRRLSLRDRFINYVGDQSIQQLLQHASVLSLLPAVCIHGAQCVLHPPVRFLHLYDAAFVSLSFLHIAATALYLNVRQWSFPRTKS